MSAHEAVEALEALGLSSYEAQVFVALQQLGTGSAQEIADVSEVPRSQVYGAADDLADRGLVEIVESSPKVYQPVSIDTAREQLRTRLERQHERAVEHLEAVHREEADHVDEGAVGTLRGRQPIVDRAVDLVESATELVALVGTADETMAPELADALRAQAAAGLPVVLVTEDRALRDRFHDDAVEVRHSEASGDGGYVGRTLLVDDGSILLAVPAEDDTEPFETVALWTADTSIGRILARFVHAGMAAGTDEPWPPE